MTIRQSQIVNYYNALAGLCDAATGVLLLLNPILVMQILGINIEPINSIYLKYIGAFVLSTGLSYFIPYIFTKSSLEIIALSKTIWISTALTRLIIFSFVLIAVLTNQLSLNWLTVGFSDLTLAIIQIILLKKYI